MKLILKVYDHQFIRNIITQEFIDSEVTIEDDVKGFGIANFTIPLINIKEDNFVEIYEVGQLDKLIFRGNVWKVKPIRKQFGSIAVECRSEKYTLNKRKVLKSKSQYEAIRQATLPNYPNAFDYYKNYWVDSAEFHGLYFYEGTESPQGGTPYYKRGYIPFSDTAFVVTGDGNVKRVENGVVYNEGPGTGATLRSIVSDLLDDYSQYESWSYDIDFDQNISLKMGVGDDYSDVFEELANQCDAIRWVDNNTIYFRKQNTISIGAGYKYKEIYYNGFYPNTSNISSIEVEGTATRANIVVGQNQYGSKIKLDDYQDRIHGVAIESFRDGDLRVKTEKLLEDSNRDQRIYKVEVESNSIDANVGERIRLVVENTNSYFDIDSEVIVLNKTTKYTNGSKTVNYSVGELRLKVANAENFLFGVQKSIKLLKLG